MALKSQDNLPAMLKIQEMLGQLEEVGYHPDEARYMLAVLTNNKAPAQLAPDDLDKTINALAAQVNFARKCRQLTTRPD